MTLRILRSVVLPVCLLALAFVAPAARADSTAELSMEDNNVLFGPDALVTARQWKAIGVDRVRVVARWNRIAPAAGSPTKPTGFDGASPTSPGYNWGELDYAITVLRAAGLKAQILIPNSGPLWASTTPSLNEPEYKPRIPEWSAFAQAVVRRYAARGVRIYLLGNEANQSFFLKPQLECRGRKCTDFSPSYYRKMLVATYPRVKAISRSSQFLIGELAPIGSTVRNTKSSLKPLAFLRGMGCVDKNFKRISSRTNPNCAGFVAARGDGFGFHPYQVKQPPAAKQKDPDLVKLGDLPKLFKTLDRLTGSGRLRASTGRFNVYLTEFGYETRPPDIRNGVSQALQSSYLQEGAYIAYATPRVKLISQYVWRDEHYTRSGPGNFQSGLLFENGTPKLALATFPNPIFYSRATRTLFGQVRPGGSSTVTVLRGGRTLRTVRTNAKGYFTLRRPAHGSYAFTYRIAGQTVKSRTVPVT